MKLWRALFFLASSIANLSAAYADICNNAATEKADVFLHLASNIRATKDMYDASLKKCASSECPMFCSTKVSPLAPEVFKSLQECRDNILPGCEEYEKILKTISKISIRRTKDACKHVGGTNCFVRLCEDFAIPVLSMDWIVVKPTVLNPLQCEAYLRNKAMLPILADREIRVSFKFACLSGSREACKISEAVDALKNMGQEMSDSGRLNANLRAALISFGSGKNQVSKWLDTCFKDKSSSLKCTMPVHPDRNGLLKRREVTPEHRLLWKSIQVAFEKRCMDTKNPHYCAESQKNK